MINNCRRKKSSKPYSCSGVAAVCTVVFIAVFILIARDCMAADINAQMQNKPPAPQYLDNPTLEEQKLIILMKQLTIPDAKQNRDYDNYLSEFHKYLDHYVRDGCKAALAGTWKLQGHNDIIYIAYNEKYKVFEGTLLSGDQITLPNRSLFLKFFFTKDFTKNDLVTAVLAMARLNIYTPLRDLKKCDWIRFQGKESWYNREQNYDVFITIPVMTKGVFNYDIENPRQHLVFIRTN